MEFIELCRRLMDAVAGESDGDKSRALKVMQILDGSDDNNRTVLQLAVEKRDETLTKRLIGLGANVNSGDKSGVFPLQVAAGMGDLDLMGLLVAAGAEINAVDAMGKTPMDYLMQSVGHKINHLGMSEDDPRVRGGVELFVRHGAKTGKNILETPAES